MGLGMFIGGLLLMNTLMCASAAGLFAVVFDHPKAMQTMTVLTAAYSIAVGTIFLLGSAGSLPALHG